MAEIFVRLFGKSEIDRKIRYFKSGKIMVPIKKHKEAR